MSIALPPNITTIRRFVFSACSSLTYITIPSGVSVIEDYAFCDCSALSDVYYCGTQQQWKTISIESYNKNLTNATIHYSSYISWECTSTPDVSVYDGVIYIDSSSSETDTSCGSEIYPCQTLTEYISVYNLISNTHSEWNDIQL